MEQDLSSQILGVPSSYSFECSLKTLNRDLLIEQTTPNASQGPPIYRISSI